MPTNFPTSVDVLVNPTPTDSLNAPAHSTQHTNANDAIEAIEGYLLNGGQGLTLVKKQTIGTAVTSVAITSAFNATYENYKIIVTGGVASTAGNLTLKLGAAATQYYSALAYVTYSTNAQTLASENNAAIWANVGSFTSNTKLMNIDISAPFLATPTRISGNYVGASIAGPINGVLNNTTSYTEFTVGVNTGNITGGTIYVYGYGIGQ
jgi:hypothetical protein